MHIVDLLQRLSLTHYVKYRGIEDLSTREVLHYSTMVGYLTEHGTQHAQNLIKVLDNLLPLEDENNQFNAEELFLLLCAVYFHDMGLLYEKTEGENWQDIRRDHPDRSYDYLNEYYEQWGFSRPQAYALQNICLGHSGDNLFHLPNDAMISHLKVRVRFLSALLRLADELDVDYTRVSRYILQLKKIPESSLVHWIKHEDIMGVYINPVSWTIEIQAMPRSEEVRHILQEMVAGKIQRELDYVRPVLIENGIYYRHVDIKFIDFGSKRVMQKDNKDAITRTVNKTIPSSIKAPPHQEELSITKAESIDIGIVIALEEEFRVLFPQIKPAPIFNNDIGQYYYQFERGNKGENRPYRCVVTFMDDVGIEKAALVSDRLINEFHPTVIVNIGIAGSTADDVLVGDIVVAKQADNYIYNSKAIPGETDLGFNFELSGDPYKSTPKYVMHASNLKYANSLWAQQWDSFCQQELTGLLDSGLREKLVKSRLIRVCPERHTGSIASGPTVGATDRFTKWLKERDRKYLAIEMESAGVMLAAHTRAVDTLVIRGISDYSDTRKSKLDKIGGGVLRRYAMHNAIVLLWVFMNAGLIDSE